MNIESFLPIDIKLSKELWMAILAVFVAASLWLIWESIVTFINTKLSFVSPDITTEQHPSLTDEEWVTSNNPSKMRLMIQRYLSGEWSFTTFSNVYYDFYIDEISDDELDNLPEVESDFFAEIHEKLDWVHEAPDDESRGYGWIDIKQFNQWLTNKEHIRSKGY